MDIKLDSLFTFRYLKDYKMDKFSYHTNELIYLINGSGNTRINSVTYKYHPNCIIYTHAGDIRDHKCSKDTDYICIRFTAQGEVPYNMSGVYEADNEMLYTVFKQIMGEYTEKNYLYFNYCNLKISEILILLSRMKPIVDKQELSIYQLIKKIDTNPCVKMSVMEMAESVAYSYDHFRHKFKDMTGLPPSEYILNKKIKNACEMLSKGTLSCSEVAEICGFSTQSQFSSKFKEKTGLSPTRYIKLFKNML